MLRSDVCELVYLIPETLVISAALATSNPVPFSAALTGISAACSAQRVGYQQPQKSVLPTCSSQTLRSEFPEGKVGDAWDTHTAAGSKPVSEQAGT